MAFRAPASARDAYTALGVESTASDEEIRQAYRALALAHHPDKARDGAREATERFQAIQAAYEAVSPANRKRYDLGFDPIEVGQSDLMAACAQGSVVRVEDLLEASADVNERDITGRTALMFAAGAGCVEAMRTLVRYHADVEARSCSRHSCLMFSVAAGLKIDSKEKMYRAFRQLDATRFLLDEGTPVNAATTYGLTALMLACVSGRVNMIELLLSRNADACAKSDIGLTALVMAADKGHRDAVLRLLEAAADPNSRHGPGRTPIMGAAAQAHAAVVDALLAGTADANATSEEGRTALSYALEKGLKDGLVCPIEGAEVRKGEVEAVVRSLLQAAADPNIPGPDGQVPLHVACCTSVALVEQLLAAGAQADVLDDAGRSPLQVAQRADIKQVLSAFAASSDGHNLRNRTTSGDAETVVSRHSPFRSPQKAKIARFPFGGSEPSSIGCVAWLALLCPPSSQ